MLACERRFIDWLIRHKVALCVALITLIALLVRHPLRTFVSSDMSICLLPWFSKIQQNGGIAGLHEQVGDYNIVYQFIIAIMTYLPLDPMYMIKFVSVAFDFLLALSVGKLAYDLSDRSKERFALAYAMTLMLPTVFLNSAAWGQCDSIYSTFCVLCVDALILNYKNPTPPGCFWLRDARPRLRHEVPDDFHLPVYRLSVLSGEKL